MSEEERGENRERMYTYTYTRVRTLQQDKQLLTRIATAIDCEGSVFIAHSKGRSKPRMVISNKSRKMLERILETVGFGSIQRAGKNHDCYDLVWQCRQALTLSTLLIGYSWLKAENMQKIIDFYSKQEAKT